MLSTQISPAGAPSSQAHVVVLIHTPANRNCVPAVYACADSAVALDIARSIQAEAEREDAELFESVSPSWNGSRLELREGEFLEFSRLPVLHSPRSGASALSQG
jgi:hypothetical protein